jgi:hypothetical protein
MEKRTPAVAAKLDVARGELEMGAQLVDYINECVQAGVFAAWGTLVASRAGNDTKATDPVF